MGPAQSLADALNPAVQQPERDVAVGRQLIEGLLQAGLARPAWESPQATTRVMTIESTV
jgi:hypothetical protein